MISHLILSRDIFLVELRLKAQKQSSACEEPGRWPSRELRSVLLGPETHVTLFQLTQNRPESGPQRAAGLQGTAAAPAGSTVQNRTSPTGPEPTTLTQQNPTGC